MKRSLARAVRIGAVLALLTSSAVYALQGGTNITFQNGTIALSGTVAVANGGTGAATLTDGSVLLGAGTGAVEFASPGNAGGVLVSAGAGVNPTFTNVDLADADAVGSTVLAVANGGTGLATLTTGNIIVGEGTSDVSFLAPTANTVRVGDGTDFIAETVPDCNTNANDALQYDQAGTPGSKFSCVQIPGGSTVNGNINVNTMGDLTQGTTLHMSPGQVDASQSRAQTIAPENMALDSMRCVASVAPGTAETFTITLADGACTGALSDSTNQTVTISGTNRTSGQATVSESVTAGECWAIKVLASSGAATSVVSCGIERTS